MASYTVSKQEHDPNLIYPIRPVRTDICPYCNAQRIELFSFNGYPQNYRDAVNERLKGNDVFYDKYEIRVMKCMSCHREFTIDWSLGFPVPLRDTFKSNQFFREFMAGL